MYLVQDSLSKFISLVLGIHSSADIGPSVSLRASSEGSCGFSLSRASPCLEVFPPVYNEGLFLTIQQPHTQQQYVVAVAEKGYYGAQPGGLDEKKDT